MVYYNLIFIVWAIIPMDNSNIIFIKLITEIWECGNLATNKSDGARNMSSQTFIEVLKTPSLANESNQ